MLWGETSQLTVLIPVNAVHKPVLILAKKNLRKENRMTTVPMSGAARHALYHFYNMQHHGIKGEHFTYRYGLVVLSLDYFQVRDFV